jgi:hypothetical protein
VKSKFVSVSEASTSETKMAYHFDTTLAVVESPLLILQQDSSLATLRICISALFHGASRSLSFRMALSDL